MLDTTLADAADQSPARRAARSDGPLRIAFLSYRSDPKVGGQGVYLAQAAAALVAALHASPDFRADFEAARAEVVAARARGLADAGA